MGFHLILKTALFPVAPCGNVIGIRAFKREIKVLCEDGQKFKNFNEGLFFVLDYCALARIIEFGKSA